jgi:hypothetical protein
VPPERPGTRKANESSPESSNERSSFEQGYCGHATGQSEQSGGDPDVVLDVPVLKVDEIDLEVEDLRAHVSLRAELADLVKVNVGVDVYLDRVKLGLKGVEAQALLKVNLERILNTLDRAIDAVNQNPQILGGAARGTGQAEDASQAARNADQGVEPAQLEDAADQGGAAEQAAVNLFDETVDEAGRTVRRAMDASGNIMETTLDESGDVVDEEITGNLADLQTEEEYVDDRGRITGRALDESGNVVDYLLDEEGNRPLPDVSEEAEAGKSEVKATDAAGRKAQELGVRLSDIRGTGSGGRILVKDVKKAAR